MRWITLLLLFIPLSISSGSKPESLKLPILAYDSENITIIHMPNIEVGNRQTEIHGYRLHEKKKPPIY